MKVIAFFAHPDDETLLAGGTLATLVNLGCEVHIISATHGEGGERGDPPLCSQEDLGEVRTRELTCAAEALGAKSLSFLGYIDPLVGADNTLYPFAENEAEATQKLEKHIHLINPDVLISHGSNGEYGHPGHLQAHRIARKVAEDHQDTGMCFYTIQAAYEGHQRPRLMNKDDPADWIIDIRPVLMRKIKAAECHESQHALIIRNTSRDLGRTVTVREVIELRWQESLHRVFPNTIDPQKDPLGILFAKNGCLVSEKND